MLRVLVLGAGKIGRTVAKLLTRTGDYAVTVADADPAALAVVEHKVPAAARRQLDATDLAAVRRAIADHDLVLSALSFHHNPLVAEAALAEGKSYFDLTEDVETTRKIRDIAGAAVEGQIFMPQCGLAPGFVSVVAYDLSKRFERLDAVHMRVGALPQFPTNALKYNLTWSTDGLINEYCNPCDAIVQGKRREVLPLEGLEHFSIEGVRYEAFNTSGGLGTLCETLDGKVSSLDYKTVRYVGHRDLAAFLVNGLRLGERRQLLKEILENAIPVTFQDVVIVFASASGWQNGQLVQIVDARKVYNQPIDGENWSAIQITTAAGVSTMIDLFASGRLGKRGFVRQEEVGLDEFLSNRFGAFYDTSLSPKLVWDYDAPAEAAE
ncbi:MAG TPA: saccharopine dehydrogenase NADP-binding domain-containing protein [Polyangiaceae bacterium]|jgi:saccharopine dehydrogenase-like NADP-dependent oxidoreductase|nr:saccharopine dehydrogenase NADP-binding domain-containing protein [Polyangiaceae bacterium]